MITVDRSEAGRANYLEQTLRSMDASGLWQSKTPFEFRLFDSGSKNLAFIPGEFVGSISLHSPSERISPKVNCGRALMFGGKTGCDWVIFCEDDIEVCKDFLDGAAAWIQKYSEQYRVITFYTPYQEVTWQQERKQSSWKYPVDGFYGTQCLAIRHDDAVSVGKYVAKDNKFSNGSYDLIIKEWHKEAYPDLPFFLATVPSFAQHIGEESSINPGRFHACSSYPGAKWSALESRHV